MGRVKDLLGQNRNEKKQSHSNYQSSSWSSANYKDAENHSGWNKEGAPGCSGGGSSSSSSVSGGTNRGCYTSGTSCSSSQSSTAGSDGSHIQSLIDATKDMDFSKKWSSILAKKLGNYSMTSVGQWNIVTSLESNNVASYSSGGDWHRPSTSTDRGHSTGAMERREMTLTATVEEMSASRWEGSSSSRNQSVSGEGNGTSQDIDSWQSESWQYGSARERNNSKCHDSSRGHDTIRSQDSIRGQDNYIGRDAEALNRWNSRPLHDGIFRGPCSSSSTFQEILQQGRDAGSSRCYSNRGVDSHGNSDGESNNRYTSTGRNTMSDQDYGKGQNDAMSITEKAIAIVKAVLDPKNYRQPQNANQEFSMNKRRRIRYGGEEDDDHRRGPQSLQGDRGRAVNRMGSSSHNEEYFEDSDDICWVPQSGRPDRNPEENSHREEVKRWESHSSDEEYQDENDQQWSSCSYDEPPAKLRKPLLGNYPNCDLVKSKSLLGQHNKENPKSLLGPHPYTKNLKPKPLLESYPGHEKPKPKPLLDPYPFYGKLKHKSLLGPYPGDKQRAYKQSRWESQMSKCGSTNAMEVFGDHANPKSLLGQHNNQNLKFLLGPHPYKKNPKPKPLFGSYPGHEKPKPLLGPCPCYGKLEHNSLLGRYPGDKQRADKHSHWESQMSKCGSTNAMEVCGDHANPKSLLGQDNNQNLTSLLGPHPYTKNLEPKPLSSYPGNEKPKPKPLLGPCPSFGKRKHKSLLGPYPGGKQRADQESCWESQMLTCGSTNAMEVCGSRGLCGRCPCNGHHAESYCWESGGYGVSQAQLFDEEYQECGCHEELEWGSFKQFAEGDKCPTCGRQSDAFQPPKLSVKQGLEAKKPALLGRTPRIDFLKQLLTPDERKRLSKRYGKLPLEALFCYMCNQSKFTSIDAYLMHQIDKKHTAISRSFHAKGNAFYHLLKTDVQLELERDRSLMTIPPVGYCNICNVPTYGFSHHNSVIANKLLHSYIKTSCCNLQFSTRFKYEHHLLSLKHLETDYQRVKAAEEKCMEILRDLKVEMKKADMKKELAEVEEEEKEVEELPTPNDRIKKMWTIIISRRIQLEKEKLPEEIISLKTLREINLRMKNPLKESSQFVPYDPSEPVGIDNMIISTQFHCGLCNKSIDPNKERVIAHCASEDHYKNAMRKREELLNAAKLQEKEKAEKEDEATGGIEKEEEGTDNDVEVIDVESTEDPYDGIKKEEERTDNEVEVIDIESIAESYDGIKKEEEGKDNEVEVIDLESTVDSDYGIKNEEEENEVEVIDVESIVDSDDGEASDISIFLNELEELIAHEDDQGLE